MNRHKLRVDDKHEFPTGLVLIGFLLVAIVWVSVIRPVVFDFLPFRFASSPPRQAISTVAIRETAPVNSDHGATTPDSTTAPKTSTLETSLEPKDEPKAEGENSGFYRYTDEGGIIHLVDNRDGIPTKYQNQTKVYRETGAATPVRIVNNQVFVPVSMRNGSHEVQATLLLDTGCTETIISEELAARLAIDPTRTRPNTARVADGRMVPISRAVIDRLTAGPKSKGPLEVSIMASVGPRETADGLLGMNFLRDFRYQIDMSGRQIHWR